MTLTTGKPALQGSLDYNITDHRHDTRMILTTETQFQVYKASMETVDNRPNIEGSLFGPEVAATRVPKSDAPGWTANTSQQIAKLNSSQKVGANQLMKVMAGDLLHTQVEYFFTQTTTNTTSSSVFSNVLSMLGNVLVGSPATGGNIKNASTAITNQLNTGTPFSQIISPDITSSTGNLPKAYLNIVFFDERFKFVPEASTSVRVGVPNAPALLALTNIRAPRNGYCLAYITNESGVNVFFDNFQVRHDRGRIYEENHYYAYGLKIAPLSSRAFGGAQNNYQYQGDFSEFDGDVGWNDFMLRSYDPQIGRFLQHDPYDQFASGYVGMGNDPANGVDPSGGYFMGADNLFSAVIGSAVGGSIVGGVLSAATGGDFFKGAAIGFGAGAMVGLLGSIDLSNLGNIKITGNFFDKLDIRKNMAIARIFSKSAKMMIDDLKERPHKVYIHYNNLGSSGIDYHDKEGAGKKGTKRKDYRGNNYPPLVGNGRGSGSTISIARKEEIKPKNIKGNYSGNTKTIRTLHELFHAWQASYGEIDYDMVDGLENNERDAVDWENLFRSELKKTPRKEYESNAGELIDVYNKDFKSRAMKKNPKKNE